MNEGRQVILAFVGSPQIEPASFVEYERPWIRQIPRRHRDEFDEGAPGDLLDPVFDAGIPSQSRKDGRVASALGDEPFGCEPM
jgi:hypothetical protein